MTHIGCVARDRKVPGSSPAWVCIARCDTAVSNCFISDLVVRKTTYACVHINPVHSIAYPQAGANNTFMWIDCDDHILFFGIY